MSKQGKKSIKSQEKITISFFSIEGSYELALNNKFSFETGIGMGAGTHISSLAAIGESLKIRL